MRFTETQFRDWTHRNPPPGLRRPWNGGITSARIFNAGLHNGVFKAVSTDGMLYITYEAQADSFDELRDACVSIYFNLSEAERRDL